MPELLLSDSQPLDKNQLINIVLITASECHMVTLHFFLLYNIILPNHKIKEANCSSKNVQDTLVYSKCQPRFLAYQHGICPPNHCFCCTCIKKEKTTIYRLCLLSYIACISLRSDETLCPVEK